MASRMLIVVLAGCYTPSPPAGAPCAPGRLCPAGLECIDTAVGPICVEDAPSDASGASDGTGTSDALGVCTTILSGGVDLAMQGWTIRRNGNAEITYSLTTTRLDTSSPAGSAKSVLLVKTGAVGSKFVLEVTARVVTIDPHLPRAAGFSILGTYNGGDVGSEPDRNRMIYFQSNAVGWGDDTGSYPVATGSERVYRLEVDGGTARLFVDNIQALSRSDFAGVTGDIAVGDTGLLDDVDSVTELRSIVTCR